MSTVDRPGRPYATLLLLHTIGVALIIWSGIPIYRMLMEAPGRQFQIVEQTSLPVIVLAVALAQSAYWYRLRRVPVVVPWRNVVLSHVMMFVARLSFIFGAALFGVVIFRHLPVLQVTDPWLLAVRGIGLFVMLFSLYCYTLELERLGVALNPATVR